MQPHSSRLEYLESLIADGLFSDAESWIEEELAEEPSDPDLHAWMAQIYLWTQRELDSLEHLALAQGGEQFNRAAQDCANYLHCRSQMAWKLRANDSKGAEALARLAEITNTTPESGVGTGVSACLIVKNEEQFLDGCLQSLKDVVQEIVVVDTGSTDATLEIAEKFGAKIGHFEWCDDFSAARNAALELAKQPWILWIDADERLEPEFARTLNEAVIRPQFGGFSISIVNEVASGEYLHSAIRLFRNKPEIRFEGRIHEQIIFSLERLGLPTANLENASIRHLGYLPEIMENRGKIDRTLRYVEREAEEDPQNPFHWFNLANTLSTRGKLPDAELAAKKCIDLLDKRYGFSGSAYHLWVSALFGQKKYKQAIAAASEAQKAGYDTVLSEFEHARALFAIGDYKNALKIAGKCCEMNWHQDLSGDYSVFQYRRWCLLARIQAQLNLYEEALATLEIVLAEHPSTVEAKELKSLVLGCQTHFEPALAILEGVPETEEVIQHKHRLHLSYGLSLADNVAALTQFSLAVTLNPQNPLGWFCSGDALYRLERYSDAATQYQTGLRLNPDHADGWFCYGNALAQIGADDAALEAYAKCLTLNPHHNNAQHNARLIREAAA